jgi:hypothetical protein
MAIIDSNGTVINGVLLTDRIGTPATPASSKHLLFSGSGGIYAIDSSGSAVGPIGSSVLNDYICIQDQKAAGTNGGTFTSGAWRTRDLNTEVSDTGGHATVASNQITLAAGTYIFRGDTIGVACSGHKALLYNVTASGDILVGSTDYSADYSTAGVLSHSVISGKFTIAIESVLEIRHWGQATKTNDGFGYAVNIDGKPEIYTTVEFWKVG